MFLSCFTQIHAYLGLLSPKNFFLYFRKTNMTLNVSSSAATFMNVSPLWTTGDSLLITEFLSSTPSVTLFSPHRLLHSLIHFKHCYWGISQPAASYICRRTSRAGQGLNHDLIRSNPEQIKNQSNIISCLNNCIIMVTQL